tara:strand:- start:366 stop:503 length:138 start_codon:yes stop_codon:yes gene_type:complete
MVSAPVKHVDWEIAADTETKAVIGWLKKLGSNVPSITGGKEVVGL